MKIVLNRIEERKAKLSQHSFCSWIEAADLSQDALIFAPSMSYFVLGFRDILELAKRPLPTNELEMAINMHCDEDKEHWKWFLKDIQTLGYLNTSPEEYLTRLWSDEERVPRNMIYFLTHLIQSESDPRLLLTIIECLEAAFAVFIEVLRPQLVKRNIYTRLVYFGQTHDLGEQSHALGSWVDGESVDDLLKSIHLDDQSGKKAIAYVEAIFNKFEEMFKHWHYIALQKGQIASLNQSQKQALLPELANLN